MYVSSTSDWKSGTLCYQHAIDEPLNTVNIKCVSSGRYVTIYNSRNQTDTSSLSTFAYINICEINVKGTSLLLSNGKNYARLSVLVYINCTMFCPF